MLHFKVDIKLSFIAFLISSILLVSCDKEDDVDSLEYGTALIDGNDNFIAAQDTDEIVFLRAQINTGNVFEGLIRENGPNRDFRTFYISLANYQGVGTYKTGLSEEELRGIRFDYGPTYTFAGYTSDFGDSDNPDFEPGTITITSDDGDYVEGTFSFIGYNHRGNTLQITNGKFKLQYDN